MRIDLGTLRERCGWTLRSTLDRALGWAREGFGVSILRLGRGA